MITPTEINEYNNGVQKVYSFENGYGASAVCHDGSYGGPYNGVDGINSWELAVLDEDGAITYHTPITQDVIGHLSEDKLQDYLQQIKDLDDFIKNQEVQLEFKFQHNLDEEKI